MNSKFKVILTPLLACIAGVTVAGKTTSFDQVKPERIGEFVTVSGTIDAFHLPPEPRAPFAFTLGDGAGRPMRVVVWPDIFERIDKGDLLRSPGTSVTLTAEVAEYNERLELHLQDWEEIDVEAGDQGTTTSVATEESTSPHKLWWGGGEFTSGTQATTSIQLLIQSGAGAERSAAKPAE